MSIRGEPEVLLGGLPYVGKTSYLALLYLAIIQGRSGPIVLGSYSDDREYLNEISQRLLRCEEAIHTEVGEERELGLSLEIDGRPVFLRIPDLSGETWEDALQNRRLPRVLDERVRGVTGIMLFVHSTKLEVGVSIAAAQQAAAELAGAESADDETTPDSDTEVDTTASETSLVHQTKRRTQPTQVSLVDLLQLLCEERGRYSARVSLVISAWDSIGDLVTPQEWLAVNCPLTDQYLDANAEWLDATIWGVSAQGGDFKDPEAREKLLKQDAIDRAQVVESRGATAVVQDPLLWLVRSTDS